MTMTKSSSSEKLQSKMGKRRSRIKRDATRLTGLVMLAIATVVIVGAGAMIPSLIIGLKSNSDSLPSGQVDINEVQPYSAAYEKSETALAAACQDYINEVLYAESYVDMVGYPYRDRALRDDGYSQIGISSDGEEFVFEYLDYLSEVFGSTAPEFFNIRDLGENSIVLGDTPGTQNDWFVLDTVSGVPVSSDVRFISHSRNLDSTEVFYNIAEMYNAYTGLDFMIESGSSETENSYTRYITTSDNRLTLEVSFSYEVYYPIEASYIQGDYYTPYYVWRVFLYVYDGMENI